MARANRTWEEVPADDRLGLHEDKCRPPFGPKAREADPEQAVCSGQTNARAARAFQDLKLVSERQNLDV